MQFNTREFNYHNGTFTAEASDLGDRFSGKDFELVSERTGRVVEMVLVGPRYDAEGDLTHWEFQPHNCYTFDDLIIFND
ncbi:hypothetical protein LCGC14_1573730 [marine sediment metagenome]|uniref:Uncharacterized protein n=1 Tax=marine sediment metagenome TaxID=412755 RepID=A0A0F9J584_9ZZZZ